MTEAAVREIVQKYARPMVEAMCLTEWGISFEYRLPNQDSRASNTCGECVSDHNYNTATIYFAPERLADEADVLRVLRHELIHLLHSELDLYVAQVMQNVSVKAADTLGHAQKFAQERIVRSVERMFDVGLEITALQLAERRMPEFKAEEFAKLAVEATTP